MAKAFSLIATYAPVATILVSGAVLYGWSQGIEGLTHVIPGSASMKITTAVCFLFGGMAMTGLRVNKRSTVVEISVVAYGIISLATMSTLILSHLTGHRSVYAHMESNDSMSSAPGVPSLCTMTDFILLCFAYLFWLMGMYRTAMVTFIPVIFSGLVATVGYAIGNHSMTCFFEGESSSMAVHTALLFLILGISGAWRMSGRHG